MYSTDLHEIQLRKMYNLKINKIVIGLGHNSGRQPVILLHFTERLLQNEV